MSALGYDFIQEKYLHGENDEYYLRRAQNQSGINYRHLSAYEIEVLVRNSNTSDDWNKILVSDAFNPELVKNCQFFGLVRIGKLEPYCLCFSDLATPVGLYSSTIISCDFGDNVVVRNVNYLSHYIIGSESMVVNVNEMVTTDHAKFGNGILKEGEDESVRIRLEICNENGGRSILPFENMLPGDAFLWSKYRDDLSLMESFERFTNSMYDSRRGFYGKIGNRSVIKNCAIIKDVEVGDDAYIKGANKLKNLTLKSGKEGRTQIGEGCELVNGIVGYGCKIFYGVKAVRFILASHSQLKYGARLINSYLGNNATISCCEVLNSLIFPAHEQHHNNSFLCAALLMGQSNIAAGATIGSNHNSRGADGEVVMERGFWPGLCVSLKHNSRFSAFTILAKGDYSSELNIYLPFSLVSNDSYEDRLQVMPGYWFLYNMYALTRNSWKYEDRDHRKAKLQHIEYDFLAPDTVNEMFEAVRILQTATGRAYILKEKPEAVPAWDECLAVGLDLLQNNNPVVDELEILEKNLERSKRKTILLKVRKGYNAYCRMLRYYGIRELLNFIDSRSIINLEDLNRNLPMVSARKNWVNVGGQLIEKNDLTGILSDVKTGKISSWDEMHQIYKQEGVTYAGKKILHGLSSLQEITGVTMGKITESDFRSFLIEIQETEAWITRQIFTSRKKDYHNEFRKIVYDTEDEMNAVIGRFEDNSFVSERQKAFAAFKEKISSLAQTFLSDSHLDFILPREDQHTTL